jgi:integrase/recombinase XerD
MERLFKDTRAIERFRSGPFGTYIQQLADHLRQQGYARGNSRWRIRIAYRFAVWLVGSHIPMEDVTRAHVHRFVARYCSVKQGDAKTLRMFFDILVEKGVLPRQSEPVKTDAEKAVDEFAVYLRQQRALAAGTIESYRFPVRQFLAQHFSDGRVDLSTIRPQDVINFVRHEAARKCPASVKNTTGALRSFLQYARYCGVLERDLSAAVPTVADWSLANIPRGLSCDQVHTVLAGCNRQTALGRRDYAVLLLLARLGLRAAEVAHLNLDDIEWTTSTILVHGKGGKVCRFPPSDVGEAIAIYLSKDRPVVPSRRVFLRAPAPHTGFEATSTVGLIVKYALARAGIQTRSRGAHQFRHTLATEMLKQGASLTDIGEVLRHQKPKTTFIYAKVDFAALRPLAKPWPGGVA